MSQTRHVDQPATDFYVLLNNKPTGPHDVKNMSRLIKAGHVTTTTLVWEPSMTDWAPANAVQAFVRSYPQLFGIIEEPRPAPAPAVIQLKEPVPQVRDEPAPGEQPADRQSQYFSITLRQLGTRHKIDIEAIRDPKERIYLRVIWAVNIILGLILLGACVAAPVTILVVLFYVGLIVGAAWVSWKLFESVLIGHCVEVGADQYPQIHSVIKQASEQLGVPVPSVYIAQGHGLFELFVAKRFTRNGVIIITSSLVDEFAKKADSREFMMFVGRQLGHIKAGHFNYWFLKNVIGLGAMFFYSAWKRHCHITADRIGLLCAGDLYSAEQALLMITVGTELAPGTNYAALQRQRERLANSFWAWLHKIFATYPYMMVRIVRLREFAGTLGMEANAPKRDEALGVLPIRHVSLRSIPLLVIHGHDRVALLELQNMLYSKFPNVVPRVMVSQNMGTLGMSEKFDKVANDLVGAIALVTPDDKGAAIRSGGDGNARARQNVVMEIGWVWGKLGRQKCLLLKRGDIELPSDLAGVEVESFDRSPTECVAAVHAFIEHLSRGGH